MILKMFSAKETLTILNNAFSRRKKRQKGMLNGIKLTKSNQFIYTVSEQLPQVWYYLHARQILPSSSRNGGASRKCPKTVLVTEPSELVATSV